MDKSRLKIEFRQKQLYRDNDIADPIVVVCNPDGTASYDDGIVPEPDWIDMTDHTDWSTLDKLQLKWTAVTNDYTRGASNNTDSSNTGSNYDKGVTGDFIFSGDAFKYIYDWLMTSPCQGLNSIEVKITDMECNKSLRLFEIKLDNTDYQPNEEPCIVALSLREKDDAIHVFKKTIIEDNWQGWFNEDGTSTKDHPTMQYVVEKKPSFILDAILSIAYLVGVFSGGIATAVNDVKRWFRSILGLTYYCPSPLIRTYIENVCDKYGFTHNTIFEDDINNPYRDAVLFFPVEQFLKNNDNFQAPSTKFIWDNRTGMPMNQFLDQLKTVFNAEWYITPNRELVFQNEAYFRNQAPIYDFSAPGAVRLYNSKYTFDGNKKPAYGRYEYRLDPQDSDSNDLKWRYNDIVDYDGDANNPMLEGSVQKSFEFAPTSFMYDGATEDFINNAINVARIAVGAFAFIGLTAIFIATSPLTGAAAVALLAAGYFFTDSFFGNYINNGDIEGSVRTSNNVINVPRLLLYDRNTPIDRAKVVSVTNPTPSPFYNPDATDYYAEHPAFDAPAGYFGGTITRVWNYPFYLDAKFLSNLFDRFHAIDNPLNTPEINQTHSAEIDMCCDMMDILGLWEGDFIKIGAVYIIENRLGYIKKARISSIEVDYETGRIMIEGRVLK